MAPLQAIGKLEFLTSKGRDLPIQRENNARIVDSNVLQDVLVEAHASSDSEQKHIDCFVMRNGRGLEGVMAIRRAAYEAGAEIPYDGRLDFINKIVYLATDGRTGEDLAAAMVAGAILSTTRDRLFIAEVDSDRAARVFEGLGFTRICTTAGRARYGYVLTEQPALPVRRAERCLDPSEFLDRLGRAEVDDLAELKRRTGFDLLQLLTAGWTTCTRYDNEFLLLVTFGQAGDPAQAAFKLDLFDMSIGAHVGYADTVVPADGDFALQDDAIADFPSSVPPGARSFLMDRPTVCLDSANEARCGWPRREGIWVRMDYRRAGIGQTLERVAGDICKLAFPGIQKLGVIFPADNLKAHEFHCNASAANVLDPLYCLEYRLHHRIRPMVAIRYGL